MNVFIEALLAIYFYQVLSCCMLIGFRIVEKRDTELLPFLNKKKNILILFIPLSFMYYIYKNIISKIPSWWKTLK